MCAVVGHEGNETWAVLLGIIIGFTSMLTDIVILEDGACVERSKRIRFVRLCV